MKRKTKRQETREKRTERQCKDKLVAVPSIARSSMHMSGRRGLWVRSCHPQEA